VNVHLAHPRGFCAGVERALEIVERALERHGAPVFVLHEIVHNKTVLAELERRGVVFVEDLDAIPPGSVSILSAHGVAPAVEDRARARGLRVIDATCPLVKKVHGEARSHSAAGATLIVIGHAEHPEVAGTVGNVPGPVRVVGSIDEARSVAVPDPERVAFVTQTTLSVDDTTAIQAVLRERFPSLRGPDAEDICYATQNRQNAVKALLPRIDLLLVVGSANSSNSNRLVELGRQHGKSAHLIEGPEDLDALTELEPGLRIGLSAGASAPEHRVQAVVDRLRELGFDGAPIEVVTVRESTTFRLPAELEQDSSPPAERAPHELDRAG